jgi:hypothetical protein
MLHRASVWVIMQSGTYIYPRGDYSAAVVTASNVVPSTYADGVVVWDPIKPLNVRLLEEDSVPENGENHDTNEHQPCYLLNAHRCPVPYLLLA